MSELNEETGSAGSFLLGLVVITFFLVGIGMFFLQVGVRSSTSVTPARPGFSNSGMSSGFMEGHRPYTSAYQLDSNTGTVLYILGRKSPSLQHQFTDDMTIDLYEAKRKILTVNRGEVMIISATDQSHVRVINWPEDKSTQKFKPSAFLEELIAKDPTLMPPPPAEKTASEAGS